MADRIPYTALAGTPKLTEWANEPQLEKLKLDFQATQNMQASHRANLDKWDTLMKGRNPALQRIPKGRSKVQPKLIRRQAEWRYAALTEPFNSSEDMFKVSPVTFEDSKGAFQNELLLNYQFRTKLNRVNFIDNLVRSIVDEGTGIVRLSWKRVMAKTTVSKPVFAMFPIPQELLEQYQQAIAAYAENPRGFNEQASPELQETVKHFEETQQLLQAKITGYQEITEEVPVINQPQVDVVNPRNFYVDPNCNGDLSKAMFAIVSFETSEAEIRKEKGKYKNIEYVNWANSTISSDPYHATTSSDTGQASDSLRKKVIAYEYWGNWDITGSGDVVPIVATWIGNTMIRLELNPFPDQKIPFVVIPYLPVKREVFGEPDAELLEDNQNVLGALMRGMIDLMGRSANSQIGYAKGMLDPVNRRRLENGEDYEFNPLQNPTNNIIEHKYPDLPQSGLLMSQIQNQEAEALTGVKSFSGGMSGEAYGEVAAGIRGVLDAASKREMAILRRVAHGISEIGSKIIAMNAVFLSKEETIRVTNQQFVKISRDDLKGSYDLKVDISTAEIDNNKAQDLAFLLQTIGNNLDLSITLYILSEICKLKRMPELAHKLLTFKKEPSPQEQEMMQLQIEEQRMKVEKLKSEIELNQARARREASQADKQDLDYVEQESGVAHNRDMAMASAQARGNQNYAITQAMTKPIKEGEKQPDLAAAIGWNTLSSKLADEGLTA